MFLFPRLFALSIFLIVTVFSCYLISRTKGIRAHAIVLLLYLSGIVIIAFFHHPPVTSDVYRLVDVMYHYADMPFDYFASSLVDSALPVMMVFYYLLGQFHVDGLLPAVTILIIFSIVFVNFIKVERIYRIRPYYMGVVLYWIMSTGLYGGAIDNIRTPMAFSLIALICYREFIEGIAVHKNLLLYVFSALIHPAALALILMKIAFGIVVGGENKIAGRPTLLLLVTTIFIVGSTQIDFMISKLDDYLSNDMYLYYWEIIITLLNIIISWIFVYSVWGKLACLKKGSPLKNIFSFFCLFKLFR